MLGQSIFSTLLTGGYDNAIWAHRNQLQFQQTQQLAEEQYQRQVDFWNMHNAYNTPSRQVRRLKQAGLNPAMLNGGNVPNTAGGLSSVSTPSAPNTSSPVSIDLASSLQSIGQALVADKQAGFLTQQTKNLGAEFINLLFERDIKKAAARLGISNAEMREMEVSAYRKALYGDSGEIVNNPFSKAMEDVDASINLKRAQALREYSNIEVNLSNISVNEADAALKDAQAEYQRIINSNADKEQKSRITLNLAQAYSNRATAEATKVLRDKYHAEIDLLDEQAWHTAQSEEREAVLHEYDKQLRYFGVQMAMTQTEIVQLEQSWYEFINQTDSDGDFSLASMFARFIYGNLNVSIGGGAGYNYNKNTK